MKIILRISLILLPLIGMVSPLGAIADEPQAGKFMEVSSKEIAIHTYGGGELFSKIFNSIAMLIYGNSKTGTGKTFSGIVRLSLVIGGFSAACLAFLREKFDPLIKHYFLPAVGITSLLLVPRTTIYIKDHLIQQTPTSNFSALIKVENVPFFLGKLATLISTLSYEFTRAIESVSHGVNDSLYNWTGHIYAGDTLLKAKKCQISNKTVEDNFREICRECVWRDLGLGLYTKDDLIHNPSILAFLEENTSSIRSVLYRDSEKESDQVSHYLPCKEAVRRVHQSLKAKKICNLQKICPNQNGEIKEVLFGELSSELGFLLGQSLKGQSDLNHLIRQQAAIDLLKEEIPGTLNTFNAKKAEIIQRENQKILGALGANSIVAMRNFFEGVVYMVFPLMLIVSLLSFGIKPLLSWLQFILWVNIWPPFFVVVNFLLNSLWQYKKSHLFGESVNVTLFTSEGLSELYSSMESIAAMAMAFIPFLSWALMKGGVSQMVHLASSLSAPAQSAAGAVAAEASSGNYSMRNVSLGSVSAYNYDTFRQNYAGHFAGESFSVDKGSQSMTFVPEENRAYVRQSDSHLREGISKTESFNHSLQKQLTNSELSMHESSRNYSKSLAESSNKAVGLVESISTNIQSGSSLSHQTLSSEQESYQELLNTANEYSLSHGVSREEAVREMMDLGVSSGLLGQTLGMKIGVSDHLQKGLSNSSAEQMADKFSKAENFVSNLQKISQFSSSDIGNALSSEDLRTHQDFSRSWNETVSSVDQLRDAYSRQESFSKIESDLKSDNLTIHQSLNQRYVDYLRESNAQDMGIVSKILDAKESDPLKRESIDKFVSSLSPGEIHKDEIREDSENILSKEDYYKAQAIDSPNKEVSSILERKEERLTLDGYVSPREAFTEMKGREDTSWQEDRLDTKHINLEESVKKREEATSKEINKNGIKEFLLKESYLAKAAQSLFGISGVLIGEKLTKDLQKDPKEIESESAAEQSKMTVHWDHYPSMITGRKECNESFKNIN